MVSLSIRIEEEVKIFPDKQKLKELTITNPALQEMLKRLFLSWGYMEVIKYIMKTYESRNLTGKGQYIIKVVDRSFIKLL